MAGFVKVEKKREPKEGEKACPTCSGTGRVDNHACTTCRGSGVVKKDGGDTGGGDGGS